MHYICSAWGWGPAWRGSRFYASLLLGQRDSHHLHLIIRGTIEIILSDCHLVSHDTGHTVAQPEPHRNSRLEATPIRPSRKRAPNTQRVGINKHKYQHSYRLLSQLITHFTQQVYKYLRYVQANNSVSEKPLRHRNHCQILFVTIMV